MNKWNIFVFLTNINYLKIVLLKKNDIKTNTEDYSIYFFQNQKMRKVAAAVFLALCAQGSIIVIIL